MCFYKSAVLVYNVIEAWDGYLEWRQLRSYDKKQLPKELKDAFTKEEFQDSQSYGKEGSVLGFLIRAKSLIVSNARLLLKVPAKLYYLLSSKSGLRTGSFAHGWLFMVGLEAISTLIDIPFYYYYHFMFEKKHGFNKMSRWEFAKDTIKTFLLKSLLLCPIQNGLIHFVVSKFGERFPFYFFCAGTVIAVATTFIYPTFISPLFNVFTPLDENGELYKKVKVLADKVNFPLKKICIVDGSRRSAHSNAYFYGFWKNKRVVIYDTLLEQLKGDDEQLLSILSHEFGHWKKGHAYYIAAIHLLQLLLISYGARFVIFNQSLYTEFGFKEMDPVLGFSIFLEDFLQPMLIVLNYPIIQLIRRHEFDADEFAVSMGYGPKLKESLLTLTKENKSNFTPDPLYSALKYTHPPLIERLNAITIAEKKRA
ncbi:unnamed protein product [Phytomonas sp. Hart1]|nr:unnamed protein product [Phytomonas sp. Hart1]|eukprot:CCW69666.1 unnamed protein product [Phytomonas sp. isolate Hart1]